MIHTLADSSKRQRMLPDGTNNNAAAGTTTATSDVIDTQGFEAMLIQIGWGAIVSGAVTSLKLQHSDASGSGFADVAGSNITVADTDDFKVSEYEVYRPQKRYWKIVASRATQNSTIDFEEVTLYRGQNLAPTQGSTQQSIKKLLNPASGTP
jgi:hypothetical protein